jgi:hypothetical protein
VIFVFIFAFSLLNGDELHQLAPSGLIDQKPIYALQHFEKQQCMAVEKITSYFHFLRCRHKVYVK